MGSGLNARRDMFGHDRLGQAQPAHAHSTQKTASLSSHHTSRQIIKNQWNFFSREASTFLHILCSPEALALCWTPASPGSRSMGSSFLRLASTPRPGPSSSRMVRWSITRATHASQTPFCFQPVTSLSGSRTLYAASAAPVRAVPSCLLQAAAAQGRIGGGVGQATCPVSSKAHHPPPTAARLHRHPHRRRQRHQARRRPGRVRPPAAEEWRHLRWSHAADVKEQKSKQMPDIKETFDWFICRHM